MALKRSTDSAGLRPVEARDYRRDTDGLVAQLADADASVRRWAARDLAAHPRAAAALCARLGEETDASVRSVLFSSAARVGALQGAGPGGSVVVEMLLPLLRSEDPALRNGAIEVLAALPEAVAPHIDRLLHDADGDVRIFSVNLLGDLKHPNVPHWLAQVLLHDTSVNVVGAALEVLAEVGTPASLPALRSAAQRFADDAYIGFAVDLAIGRIAQT
jgi:HEAT repeat protein